MACEWGNCLTCKRATCILDDELKPEKSRKEYMHAYYVEKIKGNYRNNKCAFCHKEVDGEMIRIDRKNFCGITCVLCHLYDKNESRMKIVNV